MTRTLAGADIRGYYTALGIEINHWSQNEAPVSCFADPDAHRRGDRNPSTSINLSTGAFNCHGCGAKGGAYDAALARGMSPREAIDLMVAFGVTEHRAYRGGSGSRRPDSFRRRPARQPAQMPRQQLTLTENHLAIWQGALAADRSLLSRLHRARGWTYDAISTLGLGLDHGQITIPTRDEHGELNGLLRYRPWPRPGEPKLLAVPGSQRTLLPHPTAEPNDTVLLVEGEPDMIAARSHGLAAIAVPGANGWRSEWAASFVGKNVKIVMDCDAPGREGAKRIAADLNERCEIEILDLAPERDDGHDLTDWLLGQR